VYTTLVFDFAPKSYYLGLVVVVSEIA
jgi:hypothetical protein